MEKNVKKNLRRSLKTSPCLLDHDFPKSVPPPPVFEKTIYIRGGIGYPKEKMDCYVIKLSSNDSCSSSSGGGGRKRNREGKRGADEFSPIEPISEGLDTPWSACCVAHDTTIFCIGGDYYSYSAREVIATANNPASGLWMEVTQTKAKRTQARAVAADGKIYIFGDVDSGKFPKIEVFDPIKKLCESVQPTPVSIDYLRRFFATYDPSSKKIICGAASPGVLLAYDVTGGGSWQILEKKTPNGFPWGSPGPVLLDNTLYWICPDSVGGVVITLYDMNLKKWDTTTVLGFDHVFDKEKPDNLPFFHFRGNELCLIWLDYVGIGHELKKTLLRCTRILVSKRVDSDRERIHAKAHCLSTKTYLFPKHVYRMDAVVL